MNKPLDLSPIKARLAAATPGPFKVVYGRHNLWPIAVETHAREYSEGREVCSFRRDSLMRGDSLATHHEESANAELFAHAPTDIDALVKEVERLREDLQSYQNEARRAETGEWKCESCEEWKPMEETNCGDDCDLCVPCAKACEDADARRRLEGGGA